MQIKYIDKYTHKNRKMHENYIHIMMNIVDE